MSKSSLTCRLLILFVLVFLLAIRVNGTNAQSFTTSIELNDLAWSPSGDRILVAGSFGLQILDQKAQLLFGLPNVGFIDSVAWKPDGTQFATGNDDGTIHIWDLQTHHISTTLTGHSSAITGLDWNTQNKLASASLDKTVRIWNLTTGQAEQVFTAPDKVWTVSWSRDGQTLAFGGGSATSQSPNNYIMLWKTGQTSLIPFVPNVGLASVVLSLSWSPDGTKLAGAAGEEGIWDVSTKQEVWGLPLTGGALRAAWSSNGRYVIFGDADPNATFIVDASQLESSTLQPTNVRGVTYELTNFTWSPDSTKFATASADGLIRLWSAQDGSWLGSAVTPAVATSAENLNLVLLGCTSDPSLLGQEADLIAAKDYATALYYFEGYITGGTSHLSAQCQVEYPSVLQTVMNLGLTPTPTPTATLTPSVVPTLPANVSRLRLTSMCSDDPTQNRVWRIRNTNAFDVPFTWDVYGTAQKGIGVAQANGDLLFQTDAVPNNPNTVRIFVNTILQDTKASGGVQCSTIPMPSPILTLSSHLVYVDLGVTIHVSNTTPSVGETIVYTVSYTSGGPDTAPNVVVMLHLPIGFILQSSSSPAYDAITGIWKIGSVDAGGQGTLILQVKIAAASPGKSVTVKTSISGDVDDSSPVNNMANVTLIMSTGSASNTPMPTPTALPNIADLSLTMIVTDATPTIGEVSNYVITYGTPH